MLRCGLVGKTLTHSYSPALHRLLADYSYNCFELAPEELGRFLQEEHFHGLNVTIPYKTAVIPYCAALSASAREIGSVNTILRRPDGSLFGDNTDAAGFSALLESSGLSFAGKKVLVLGSGGASLTVCHVLRHFGAGEVVVISRNGPDHYGNLERHQDAHIIVNSTPVGMYPHNGTAPLNLRQFPQCEGVFDLIYNPAHTALMLQAEALGIPAFGGLPMLVYQAKAAAELFTGQAIEDAKAKNALHTLQAEMQTIVLIGMPGCGKTTVGQPLALSLGREFVDADHCLEVRAGKPIPEIFAEEGEAGFRARETAVLQELGARSGLVLATGGGCVTREENYPLLHQNAVIVFLTRPLDQLAREGRPLSEGSDLTAMYENRLSAYQRFADVTLQNDAPPETVAAQIREAVYETTHS